MIEIKGLVETFDLVEIFAPIIDSPKEDVLCVEVGVFTGKSVCTLAQLLRESGKRATIYAVDHWICDNISKETEEFMGVGTAYEEEFHKNLTLCNIDNVIAVKKDSLEAVKDFAYASIDFLLLDGNHVYPHTKKEILAWLPKLKPDAIISGHDYCVSDISRAVDEVFGGTGKSINVAKSGAAYWIQL